MVVKIRSDGVIEKVKLFRYFKGSHKVQNITLFAPFDSSYSIAVNFKLPDGSTHTGIMIFQDSWENDEALNAWQYPIRSRVTAIPGRVEVAFTITQEGQVLSTAITHFIVEDSIGDGDIIAIDDPTTLDELLKIIDEKIKSTGAKCKVWTGIEEPDTEEYDTWFKPALNNKPMNLPKKTTIPELEDEKSKPLDLPEIKWEDNNNESPEIQKEEEKTQDVPELKKDEERPVVPELKKENHKEV